MIDLVAWVFLMMRLLQGILLLIVIVDVVMVGICSSSSMDFPLMMNKNVEDVKWLNHNMWNRGTWKSK